MNIPKWMYEPIAHRGYFNNLAPENSIKAFQNAIEAGFAVEMDVQLTKDQVLVVFHDDNLMRMTGFDGLVRDQNYEDIKDLKLLGTDEIIPRFDDFLILIDGQIPLMIEFKNETNSRQMEILAYEMLKVYKGQYIIQSFNPMSVNWFRKHAKSVIRGQLSYDYKGGKQSWILRFILRNVLLNIITRPHYVIYDIKALDRLIIKWLKLIKKPLFGFTAKSKIDYIEALEKGVPACFEGFDPRK